MDSSQRRLKSLFRAVVALFFSFFAASSLNAQSLVSLPSTCPLISNRPQPNTALYVGYLDYPTDGLAITVEDHPTVFPSFGETIVDIKVPLRGVWLGISSELPLIKDFGIIGTGGLLVPSRTTSRRVQTLGGPLPGPQDRSLNNFSIVDAALFLNMPASAKILGGFRWDRLDTTFRQDSLDRIDFTINAFLPYLGVQLNQGNVVVRLIGFPAAPGNLRWEELRPQAPLAAIGSTSLGFKSGAFLELFGSYSKRLSDSMEIAGYLTYNYLNARTVDESPPVLNFVPEKNSFAYNRRYWIVGGSIMLDFNLPI